MRYTHYKVANVINRRAKVYNNHNTYLYTAITTRLIKTLLSTGESVVSKSKDKMEETAPGDAAAEVSGAEAAAAETSTRPGSGK